MVAKTGLLLNATLLSGLLAFSHALLKAVASKQSPSYVELLSQHWFQIGLALSVYGFVFFYYIQVLRGQDIGALYSIYTGLSILFVLLTGMIVFGEALSMLQIVGCLFIIAGVLLIGTG